MQFKNKCLFVISQTPCRVMHMAELFYSAVNIILHLKSPQLTQNVLGTFVFGSLMVRFQRTVWERSGNVPRTLVSHMWLVRFSFSFGSFATNLLGTFPERWSLICDKVRFSFSFGSFPTNLLGTFPERWSLICDIWFVFRCLLVRSQRTFWERSQNVGVMGEKYMLT